MAYLSKDTSGVIQLWNNKPKWNEFAEFFIGWIEVGVRNEVAVDVTKNDDFRGILSNYNAPIVIKIETKYEVV